MEIKNILGNVSEAVTEEPYIFFVILSNLTWYEKILAKLKIKEPKKRIEIPPINMGTLLRISKQVLEINPMEVTKDDWVKKAIEAVTLHADRMVYIIAAAIHNKKSEVPKALIDFVFQNFTANDMAVVVEVILNKMNTMAFMISISSAIGLNVLDAQNAIVRNAAISEESLQPGETIAPGT
jgi:hypothetical protein